VARTLALLSLGGTSLILLLLGFTLLVGVGADWLATRFRIPDVLWLIALGILAGPVLGLLSSAPLLAIAPVLGTAALVLILFDAGIDLKLSRIRLLASSAIVFAAATYFISAVVVFVGTDLFLLPGQTVPSLVFALAMGCTSGAVVIPLANRLRLPEGLRSFMRIDGAVEDTLAILSVTTLLVILAPSSTTLAIRVTTSILLPLPVGVAVGVGAGVLWLLFLYAWQDRPFSALATLGFLFVTYAVAQGLGGSGIVAALLFGGVIGNEAVFRRFLRHARIFRISAELRKVEVELGFILRAFFLFLVGLLVTLRNPGWIDGLLIVLFVGLLVVTRVAIFPSTTDPRRVPQAWRGTVGALYGRGLTSAVLLIVPLALIPAVAQLFFPALLLIVGTNVVMTAWLFAAGPPVGTEPELEQRWAAEGPQLLTFGGDEPEGDAAPGMELGSEPRTGAPDSPISGGPQDP
jgi:cell volume regulation protein A